MQAATSTRPIHQTLVFGAIALLAVFLVYPILLTVRGGFAEDPATSTGFTLSHVLLVFEDPVTREGLVNAFTIAVAVTLGSILLSLPLAIISAGYSFPGKKLWNAVVLIPLILPPFVGAIGLQALLGRQGAANTILESIYHAIGEPEALSWLFQGVDILGKARFWGVVFVEVLHLYPIIYLNAVASLANLDPALDESAENLGAGRIRRFFSVTLPLIRPGLFAGATIVFIWSFTELGTPLMFDYTTVTPVQIFNGLKEVENSAQPYALTVVLLGGAILAYIIGKAVFGRRGYAMTTRASRAATETRLGLGGGLLATFLFGLVTFLAVLPHLGVILTSVAESGSWYRSVLPRGFTLDHFREALGSGESFTSIRNSLFLASSAVIINAGAGVLVGYLIVRTKARGRALLDSLCMLPLAVPGLVMAFGYVALTLGWPFEQPLHVLGMDIPPFLDGTFLDLEVLGQTPNPFPLLIIAYAVRRLPYMVRSTVAGLEQTSGDLEEAAVNLGASRMRAIRSVILPLIAANLIAGALLVFSFSMLEVSDSLLLAQRSIHYPITKMIFSFTMRLGDGPFIASAMGVWGMALLTVTLIGASVLLGKRMGAIFRA